MDGCFGKLQKKMHTKHKQDFSWSKQPSPPTPPGTTAMIATHAKVLFYSQTFAFDSTLCMSWVAKLPIHFLYRGKSLFIPTCKAIGVFFHPKLSSCGDADSDYKQLRHTRQE